MNHEHHSKSSTFSSNKKELLDKKLATYLAAVAGGSLVANEADAVVVSNSSPQAFDVDDAVPIDFNGDGQIDFEIDHDRVELGGGNEVDYLQIDKNDVSGASPGEDPLAFPSTYLETFPLNGTEANDTFEAAYVVPNGGTGVAEYPAALLAGQEIGPNTSAFDFQEGDNAFGSGDMVRANRLFDEDHTQVDTVLGGHTADEFYPISNSPGWEGLGGEVRYLGVRMDFQNSSSSEEYYGWIGIRILDEDDATGEVVGWGYETEIGMPILAGEEGVPTGIPGDFNEDETVDAADYAIWRKTNNDPGDYDDWRTNFGESSLGAGGGLDLSGASNAVPEPSSLLMGLLGTVVMMTAFVFRRFRPLR